MYNALDMLDELLRPGSVLALVYLSGTAVTPLWLYCFANAVVWQARTTSRRRMASAALIGLHLVLALALVASGRLADAAFTGLSLIAIRIAHTASSQALVRAASLREERDRLERRLRDAHLQESRDRLARELHDGLGAEVTALLLRLRREARHGTRADAAALTGRVQDVLDELRGVVWSLRNEQGTLAELGKLIDASCRRMVEAISYRRHTPPDQAQRRIGSSAALDALEAARALVIAAVSQADVTSIDLTLSAQAQLEIQIRHDGSSQLARASILLDDSA